MKIGVVFPQGEISDDPIAVRDFAQAVEELGYDYLLLYELVIDTKSDKPPASFLEPFALLGYLVACTQKIELATGVMVLPSRQTVLVAKQAAASEPVLKRIASFGDGWLSYGETLETAAAKAEWLSLLLIECTVGLQSVWRVGESSPLY
jgi:alkanesulfonate monooxygenase SsuD/methylene tetrahydromethanopterin reductase-like flavin-dependent oxidoreductase (luciferase family)